MPKCRYCEEELSMNVLSIHEKWHRKQKNKEKKLNITDLNASPAIDLIEKTQDSVQLKVWLEEEVKKKGRSTVIDALEDKLKEFEGEK